MLTTLLIKGWTQPLCNKDAIWLDLHLPFFPSTNMHSLILAVYLNNPNSLPPGSCLSRPHCPECRFYMSACLLFNSTPHPGCQLSAQTASFYISQFLDKGPSPMISSEVASHQLLSLFSSLNYITWKHPFIKFPHCSLSYQPWDSVLGRQTLYLSPCCEPRQCLCYCHVQ